MKKHLSLIVFTFLGSLSSLEARFPKINPQWVAAIATAASSAYGYYKKDEIQEKAVETTMHLIDEYAKPAKRDAYASTVFSGLKKYKSSLLPLMQHHYDKRFFDHIRNEKAPLASEEQSLKEYTEIIAPKITQIPTQTAGYLISHNRAAHSWFTHYAIENIKSLKSELAQLLIDKEPETKFFIKKPAIIRIMDAAVENYKDVDASVLNTLLFYSDELKDTFVDLAVQYPEKKYSDLLCLIRVFDSWTHPTENDVKRVEKLTKCAREHFNTVPSEFIQALLLPDVSAAHKKFPYNIFRSPSLANVFTDKILENIAIINPEKLDIILDRMNYKNRGIVLDALRDCIKRSLHNTAFSLSKITTYDDNTLQFIQIYNKHTCWFRKPLPFPLLPQQITQTEAHALVMKSTIKDSFNDSLKEEPVKQFIKNLHDQEKIEQQDNKITFVHGCAWDWDLKQDLFTKLMEIKYRKNFENYRFLRFKSDFTETIEDEKKHKKLNSLEAHELRDDVLFMNHALFGNSGQRGSCTFDYWLKSHDMSILHQRNQIDIENLFKCVNLEQYFERYKKEIIELTCLHKKAENKGLILLISADTNNADNYIYPTRSGAAKSAIITNDYKALSKASECINMLKKNPINLGEKLDSAEYGMLLSNKYALNPDKAGKDIKIFPFSLAHGTKEYARYCKKRDQLINKIKQDIEEQKNPLINQESKIIHILNNTI